MLNFFSYIFFKSFRGIPRNVDLSSVDGGTNGGIDGSLNQIEAKYPALLFKQQLTAYVEKIYGMIRDNLKKEISPQLGLCIQVMNMYNITSLEPFDIRRIQQL